jgi:hypothetical protein
LERGSLCQSSNCQEPQVIVTSLCLLMQVMISNVIEVGERSLILSIIFSFGTKRLTNLSVRLAAGSAAGGAVHSFREENRCQLTACLCQQNFYVQRLTVVLHDEGAIPDQRLHCFRWIRRPLSPSSVIIQSCPFAHKTWTSSQIFVMMVMVFKLLPNLIKASSKLPAFATVVQSFWSSTTACLSLNQFTVIQLLHHVCSPLQWREARPNFSWTRTQMTSSSWSGMMKKKSQPTKRSFHSEVPFSRPCFLDLCHQRT